MSDQAMKTRRSLKRLLLKSLPLYDSNYMTFWKSKTVGSSKKISGCQG